MNGGTGAPTLAFFLRMDPARWGHFTSPHRMADLTSEEDLVGAAERETARFVEGLAARAEEPSQSGG